MHYCAKEKLSHDKPNSWDRSIILENGTEYNNKNGLDKKLKVYEGLEFRPSTSCSRAASSGLYSSQYSTFITST